MHPLFRRSLELCLFSACLGLSLWSWPTLEGQQAKPTVPTAESHRGPVPNRGLRAYVGLSFNSVLGPLGYVPAHYDSMGLNSAGLGGGSLGSVFPSIYFYISADPVDLGDEEILKELKADPTKDDPAPREVTSDGSFFKDRQLEWMSVHIELTAKARENETVPDKDPCRGLQILEIAPNSTVSEPRGSIPQATANTISEVVTSLAPASIPNGALARGASQGLAVLYNNLTRPRPVAYQYAEMENSCHFGWYFQKSGDVSLLGLQTGLVLLRAPKEVGSITVTGHIISRWKGKNLTTDDLTKSDPEYKLVTRTQTATLQIPPSDDESPDYGVLHDLSNFPMLIPVAQVATILHTTPQVIIGMSTPIKTCVPRTVDSSPALASAVASKPKQSSALSNSKTKPTPPNPPSQSNLDCVTSPATFVITPKNDYVTRHSLESYLGVDTTTTKTSNPPNTKTTTTNAPTVTPNE